MARTNRQKSGRAGDTPFGPGAEPKERPAGRTAAEAPWAEGKRAALRRSQRILMILRIELRAVVFTRAGGWDSEMSLKSLRRLNLNFGFESSGRRRRHGRILARLDKNSV